MLFRGDARQIKKALAQHNITHAISIGRRAPMHRMHVACLQEIQEAGLQPVLIIGSTNNKLDRFYDPIRNPLTYTQQLAQLQKAIPSLYNEEHIIPLADQEDANWMETFVAIMREKNYVSSAVVHYRVKTEDKSVDRSQIKPLNSYMQQFIDRGLSVWESHNQNAQDDTVHASDLRKLDLSNLTKENRRTFAAADYIIDIAQIARANNPDKHMLEAAAIQLTMLDLSLERLRLEVNITTAQIIQYATQKGSINVESIIASVYEMLQELCKNAPPES